MPCGGVHPCEIPEPVASNKCWFCDRLGCGHFYEEFDTFCHAACFLRAVQQGNEDAILVFAHGHTIRLDTSRDQISPADFPQRRNDMDYAR